VGKPPRGTRARSIARKLAMQALYQWQLTQQTASEIKKQFLDSEDSAGVDREHFEELVGGCIAKNAELSAALQPFIDRPLDQLDPVETAILMIGMFELQQRADIPYRVVINEGGRPDQALRCDRRAQVRQRSSRSRGARVARCRARLVIRRASR
jgi:N utilization substance protein B